MTVFVYARVCVRVCVCACARSVAELMIYVGSQQTLVLEGVGMDGAAPSAPTFARFAKGVSAAIISHNGIEVRRDRRGVHSRSPSNATRPTTPGKATRLTRLLSDSSPSTAIWKWLCI